MTEASKTELILSCIVPGQPKPKERPRVERGRGRTPQSTLDAEEYIRQVVALEWRGREPYEGEMALTCWFYGANGNCDGDNLLKLVSDALQGQRGAPFVYKNDSKIKDWHGHVRKKDAEGPRTVILLTALPTETP